MAAPVMAAPITLVTDDITTRSRYSWSDNPDNLPGTTAVVDTDLREIRLPAAGNQILDSRPGPSLGLVLINGPKVETYAFDGERMSRVDALSFDPPTGAIGVAGRHSITSVLMIDTTSVKSWYFDGSAMVENPMLGVTGLNTPTQVATRTDNLEVVVLDGTEIKGYSFDGQQLRSNPYLSPVGLAFPVAFALHPTTYDMVVLDGDRARYYNWDGTGLRENPTLSLSGLQSPVSVQLARDGTLYVANESGVDAYSFDGTRYQRNEALSVMGLSDVLAVAVLGDDSTLAVRMPTEVRFFQFDGSRRRENEWLRISGLELARAGKLVSTARAVSVVYPVSTTVEALAISAGTYIPPGASIEFQVSNDRGLTWKSVYKPGRGAAFDTPSSAGAMWRAILRLGTNEDDSPKVLPDIVLEQVHRPVVANPYVDPTDSDGITRSAWPVIRWTFQDDDMPEDHQTAYQVIVYERDTGQEIYNSGKISTLADPEPITDAGTLVVPSDPRGSQPFHMLTPEALNSGYRFQYKVRVWDKYDIPSVWTELRDFEVLALYNLTISDIVHPPPTAPALPTQFLPVPVKAGAQFSFYLDSMGAIDDVRVMFSDGGVRVLAPRLWTTPAAPLRNTWDGAYFTAPNLESGTLLYATFVGTRADGKQAVLTAPIAVTEGSIYDDFTVILTN